ncbi:MAG: hypothetical protein ABSH08_09895, partial [Tepidisphaeraceae bacterium]
CCALPAASNALPRRPAHEFHEQAHDLPIAVPAQSACRTGLCMAPLFPQAAETEVLLELTFALLKR